MLGRCLYVSGADGGDGWDPGWSLAGLVGLDGVVEVGLGWWFRWERLAVAGWLVRRFWFSVVGGFEYESSVRDPRCSVFGLLVLFRLRWFCLPCVRCLVLLCVPRCVALRSVPVGMS